MALIRQMTAGCDFLHTSKHQHL